jgi:hypothetical protein
MDLTQANEALTKIGDAPSARAVADALAVVMKLGDALPERVVWRILHTYAARSVIGSQLSQFGEPTVRASAPWAWYATVACVLRDCPGKRAADRREATKATDMPAVEQVLWREVAADDLQEVTVPDLERAVAQGCAEAGVELERERLRLARIVSGSTEVIQDRTHTVRLTMVDSLADLRGSRDFAAGMRYLCKAFWRCARSDRSFLKYLYLDEED